MKRFIGIFTALLLPLAGNAQLYIDTVKDVDAQIFIPKQRYARAQQGMEIYDDLIFSIEDGGHVNVYDFRTADPKPIAMFELASSQKDNHANNASFGIETKKDASEVIAKGRENGLLVLKAKNKVRLLPPLNITREQLSEALEILKKACI